MANQRKKALYLIAVAFAGQDAVRRLMQTIRPFDWVVLGVDVLILILVGIEAIPPLLHRHRASKRRKELFALALMGQAYLQEAPLPLRNEAVQVWGQRVDAWIGKTNKVLQDYSLDALAKFNYESKAGEHFPHISQGAWPHYARLISRLENLQSIIEKPEIYY